MTDASAASIHAIHGPGPERTADRGLETSGAHPHIET
jgi:hypothetical protein